MADALDLSHLLGHVYDAEHFEVPRVISETGRIPVPQVVDPVAGPSIQMRTGVPMIDQIIEPLDFHITKFMLLEILAAVLIAALFIALAARMKSSASTRGRLWNMLEAMLLFIRDEVARPAIGKHDADRFLPFLWTIFFFVLTCNLLGMIPWLGSPTGAIAATGTLALFTFLVVTGTGMAKMGVVGFWTGQVPHMDVPFVLGVFLKPMIFVIEVLGLVIKHFVLCVRLLANMLAGHLVLAVLVAFVAVVGAEVTSYFSFLFVGVSVASVLAATALSLLELFVAFLQAYIFTFLSALFIGMAVHPH